MEEKLAEQPLTLENAFSPDLTLAQIFDNLIKIGTQGFVRDKALATCAFLILRDFKNSKYKVIILPMPSTNPEEKYLNSTILQTIVTKLKKQGNKDMKLIAVVKGGDAHMSVYDKDEAINKDGSINRDVVTQPSKDKNAKDVLLFELEEAFTKHTKVFEYIISDEGDVVISSKPYIDSKQPYNDIEARNSNFSYTFTEGQGLN